LKPLDLPETAAYIAGRIRRVGGQPGEIFTKEAIVRIYGASSGIPRSINVLCDNALIGGFAAQVKPIGAPIVEDVCRDFDLVVGPGPGERDAAGAGACVALSPSPPVTSAPAGPASVATSRRDPDMFALYTRKRRFSFF
jgi:hypothetical protein